MVVQQYGMLRGEGGDVKGCALSRDGASVEACLRRILPAAMTHEGRVYVRRSQQGN